MPPKYRGNTSSAALQDPVPVVTSAAEAPKVIAEEPALSPPAKFALWTTLLFTFFRFSYLHELLTARVGVDLHLMIILGSLAVLSALAAGTLFSALTHRIMQVWLAFTLCFLLACFFGFWRGGAFAVFVPFVRTSLILCLLIPAAAPSKRALSQVLKTVGVAGLVFIVVGLTSSDIRTGRLELVQAGGSASNSNDYAALVVLVLPAIAYLTLRQGANVFLKVAGVAALGMGCFLILSTGSRGALISLALSTAYVFKISKMKMRIGLALGLPLLFAMVLPFVPDKAMDHLRALVSGSSADEVAMESQEQRTELLKQSFLITLQHPLLGVGPGSFQEYQAMQAREKGVRGMWHETHNSYTQISSECGIPALIFFVTALVMTLRVFGRGRKSADPEIRGMASVLALMLVSFAASMFFLAQGYGFGFPVMGGIAICMDKLLKKSPETLDSQLAV